jgi:CheY-like chemotaxis protein
MMAPFNTRLLFANSAADSLKPTGNTNSQESNAGESKATGSSLYLGSTSSSSSSGLGGSGNSSAWGSSLTRSDTLPFCHKLIIGTILVVDDSAVIRKLLSKYLNDLKCPHQLCSDGEEALAWFREHHADCAAIITDQEMPRMGGDALIAKSRVINPSVPCFIVSGNEISPSHLSVGARRAIVKPISASALEGIVDEIEALQLAESSCHGTES